MTEPLREQSVHLQVEQVDGLVAAAGVDGAMAILEAFQRSTTDLLASMQSDLAQNALSEASRTAHAIKGSAANVGAEALAKAACDIETACRENDFATAGARFEDLNALYGAFCAAYKDHLERF
ncbi:Hpt domain-containing protein [Hyphococcus sp.]|uniref:Hpt domain-containing protein n=1 Tax=Hyphococcus sp. TaxID=2038636 RepID=UPI003CCBCB3B